MDKKRILVFFLLINIFISCRSKDNIILNLNKCYDNELARIRSDNLYKNVFLDLEDTFKILKTDKRYFGVSTYVENKIDSALFLKSDKTQCLLLVLQRVRDTFSFGQCRVIRGFKKNDRHWSFEVAHSASFDKDYFNMFRDNSFANISKLARYFVINSGNISRIGGCNLDENYWFNSKR